MTSPATSPTSPAGLSTGGGGGGNPDLVSGGAPTNGDQALASGTTSSNAITFQAPTGGSGSSTPSVALDQTTGTGATLSGSGLGAYTVNSLEDGDICRVVATHTDDGDGQVVTDVAVVAVGQPAGVSYPDTILDWSSSSETFAAGAGAYTIGGLSVTYDYDGTSGPDTIDLTNGVLTVTTSGGGRAYLVIDLGEDVSREAVAHYMTCTGLSAAAGTQIIFKVAANATIGNANNQAQFLIGTSGSETAIRSREANGVSSLTTCNDHTVTDITTTPTRVCFRTFGDKWADSWDQGSTALPTDGAALANTGTNDYQDGSGANAPNDRRYVHILVLEDATIRIGSQVLRIAP